MQKMLYRIGEVAEMLGENVSLVRFWSKKFDAFIHPVRNAKGNRMFSAEDVETFRRIHHMVGTGLTLEGVARRLKESKTLVDKDLKILDSLKSIRGQLVEVRASMSRKKQP